MNKPDIRTAIPKRRYRYGEFSVIFLGDIESEDDFDYTWIAAVVQGDDPEPGLYLTAERPAGRHSAEHDMRIIMRDGAEVIGSSKEWGGLDVFVDEALSIIARVLALSDETPYPMS